MGNRRRASHLTREQVLAAAPDHNSIRSLAFGLGLNSGQALHYHLETKGWKDEVLEVLGTTAEDGGPAPMLDTDDATTAQGRELMNLRANNKDLARQVKKLQQHLLEQENFIERVRAVSSEPLPSPGFDVRPFSQGSEAGGHLDRDAIIPLYDLQFGQRVRREDTPSGINEFNEEVFVRRLSRWVEAVVDIVGNYSESYHIENLILPLGGDMVEGWDIFAGQEWQLEHDPIEQVLRLKNILGNALHEVLGYMAEEIGVRSIAFTCVSGNHGKPRGRKSGAIPSTFNFDRLFYVLLQDHLKNYPIDLFAIEPAGEVFFESRGWIFRQIHGHEIRGWGSIPFYGFTRHDAKAVRMHNQLFDYLLLGHHHEPASIPIGEAEYLMSGNWVGGNNLSNMITAAGSPSQWLYFCSEEYGVGDRSLIHLESRKDRPGPMIHSFS